MLKTILLASAMAVTAPAMAQDMPQQTPPATTTAPAQDTTQTTPADVTAQQAPTTQAAPIPGTPTTDPAPVQQATAPATDQPTTPADPAATTAPAETAVATATPEATAPAAGASQIAQVVNTEFPTYDKNADKSLDKAEFGQWMVALKTASDPSTKAADPATRKWVDGAFASADTDKSKSVTQAELTTYLSQGAG